MWRDGVQPCRTYLAPRPERRRPPHDHRHSRVSVRLLDGTAWHEVLKWLNLALEVQLLAASTQGPMAARDGLRFLATHRFTDTTDLDVL
jgi:hypothetical protein